MYKILGADQREYGPVSAQQIIDWVNQGRAGANTLARAEGTESWLPLSSIPEFAGLFAAGAPKTPPSSSTPPPTNFAGQIDTDAAARSVLARGGTIAAGHCISRGWDLVMKNFWLLVGASLVMGLIEGAIPLLTGVCRGGLFILTLKLIRGQSAEFGDAFAGFSDNFLQLFLVGLISLLLTAVGLAFCIIPGIYLAVAWSMAITLVADRKMEFWPAMELSRKVMNQHWWSMFGLLLLCILISLLGLCVCCIGVYVAMPVVFAAWAYAYEDIFGSTPAPATQPS
ncbi:MAG: GYF domain-containing protein [Limisphaerales bacterium]